MPNIQYRIKEKYIKVTINDSYTILSSESDSAVIQSKTAIKVLDLIGDESISIDDLVKNYKASSLSELLLTLYELETDGYITSKKLSFPPEQNSFWEEMGCDPSLLARIFNSKPIAIKSIGNADISYLEEACKITGIQFSSDPYLTIVCTSGYLHPELMELNQKFIRDKKPWLLIKLNGITPFIGPLFSPNEVDTPCWSCLQHRLTLHNQKNKLYNALNKTDEFLIAPIVNHPIAQNLTANELVLELASILYDDENTSLKNFIKTFDLKTKERTKHRVIKRPQCEVCGDDKLLLNHPKPIRLNSQEITAKNVGGYRSVPPEDTLAKYKKHVSPITGVVPYLKEYFPIQDAPFYNFGSGKNLALQSTSMFWLNMHLRSANGGKGKTEIQAKTGALCEAIERYSLMYNGKTYTISGSFNNIEHAIHPNTCMLYSENQHKNRIQINEKSTKFYSLIPIPFDTEKEIDWTPVYNLTKNQFNYLPSSYCYAQYPAQDEKKLISYPDSNGCAAGNTMEEAILQGFLELVERDAAAIWWYNRIQHSEVNLKSAENPYINQVVKYYKEINRSLYVLDISTDFNIPVFVAISHCQESDDKDKIMYAFGCHVDASIALERAIIELNQLLPIVVSNKEGYLTKDSIFINWLDNAQLRENKYLVPNKGTKKNMKTDYPQLCKATIHDSVSFCIETVKEQGLETLVLDLTQPDVGLPVVKVMVPGLRHFWRRTAPGRLYDVPIKMGWLPKKNSEQELNPWSIFI